MRPLASSPTAVSGGGFVDLEPDRPLEDDPPGQRRRKRPGKGRGRRGMGERLEAVVYMDSELVTDKLGRKSAQREMWSAS